MTSTTLTAKGQITLPKEIRDRLHLRPGDRVNFRQKADGSIVVEAESVDLLALQGTVKPRRLGVTIEQMNRDIRKRGGRA
ncbi:MAG: AbrB/MazE/SpoVT family DNA-binding domain-containing protein [Planctomycetes bacterium]|nr:AbrB/MazE/SpoVT family DNA-binding domain-containing protein [Planctomycetota bacterium]